MSVIRKMENIIPNRAKSTEGKWYGYSAQYKITEVKSLDEKEKKAYRITLTFPTAARTGIYPKEITIQESADDEHGWACYYYGMSEKEVSKAMRKMARRIAELQRLNNRLRRRNLQLESHFTKTIFDNEREQENRKGHDMRECEFCTSEIDTTKAVEGRDFTYLGEGEIAHINCAVKEFQYVCAECGTLWGLDNGGECEECNGSLDTITKKEVLKKLTYDAVQHYLPSELRGRFKVSYISKK